MIRSCVSNHQVDRFIKRLCDSIDYRPPYNAKTRMFDFYVLAYIHSAMANTSPEKGSGFIQPDSLKDDIDYAVSVLLPALKADLLDTVRLSVVSELQYGKDDSLEVLDEPERKELENPTPTSSSSTIRTIRLIQRTMGLLDLRSSVSDGMKLAKQVFAGPSWWDYGGSVWSRICDGYLLLDKAVSLRDMFIAIDHVFDLQHNNGSVLDRSQVYKDWINQALNFKRDVQSHRDLLPYCSSGLRKLAHQALKAAGEMHQPS